VPGNWVQRRLSTQRLWFVAEINCTTQQCFPGHAEIAIGAFKAEITDPRAPTVSGVEGALASNPVHAGLERVVFNAVDAGVGVYRAFAQARVDSNSPWQEIASTPKHGTCSPLGVTDYAYEFDSSQPCPLTVAGMALDVDTARLLPGVHQLRVLVEDAAGNRTVVMEAPEFRVGALAESPAPSAVPNVLRIAGPARRRVASRKAFGVSGTLTDPNGSPLAGVPLTIRARTFLPKSRTSTGQWTEIGQVTTRANGRFSARIAAGLSRTIQISAPSGAVAQIDVAVPARVSVRARRDRLRNGQSVVFTGRVAGPIPRGGVGVALEVREGKRWVSVPTTRRAARTNGKGRFRLSYRFRRTFQRTTYRFRVVADEDSAFQYTRGVSRTIAVNVRP
jgi:hypothetical protein